MTVTAAEVARRDQLQAARADNLTNARDLLRALGHSRYPRAVSRAVVARYVDQLTRRGLRGCPHQRPDAPAPGWWVADDPSVMRCASCASAWMRRTGPLPAGCDLCGNPGELHPVAVPAAGALAHRPDGGLGSCPPAVLLAAACATCWTGHRRPA